MCPSPKQSNPFLRQQPLPWTRCSYGAHCRSSFNKLPPVSCKTRVTKMARPGPKAGPKKRSKKQVLELADPRTCEFDLETFSLWSCHAPTVAHGRWFGAGASARPDGAARLCQFAHTGTALHHRPLCDAGAGYFGASER